MALRSHECPQCESLQTDIVPFAQEWLYPVDDYLVRPAFPLSVSEGFDDEIVDIFGSAFEGAWQSLQVSGSRLTHEPHIASTRELLARCILALGKRGERDRNQLVEKTLALLAESNREARNPCTAESSARAPSARRAFAELTLASAVQDRSEEIIMSNQYSGRHPNDRQRSDAQNPAGRTRKQGSDSLSQVSGAAQNAASTAKKAASEAASTITDQVKELLDSQLANGVEMVGYLGNSAKRAADDLDQNAPQLAGLVRGVADRIEGYAYDMRDQSVDQLFRSASNFTRRQPALVFGLAALAGFFAFRTIKSTPLPTQPVRRPSSSSMGEYHGG
jgi:hypothetical protein